MRAVFTFAARDLVRAAPGTLASAVDRREQAFEDTAVMSAGDGARNETGHLRASKQCRVAEVSTKRHDWVNPIDGGAVPWRATVCHALVKVTIYTDPGCPFGFNAQRQELQLMWHYGHAADVGRRMIVLSERSSSFEGRGLTPELVARTRERLTGLYGMPMGSEPVTRLTATIDACRAYVGARMHAPDRALALLRSLRRRAFSDQQPLDDFETIRAAAGDAGLAAGSIESWLADAEVDAALRADMAATRDPLPEALALSHKLSKSDGGFRYSTSSAVFEHEDRRVVAAGFQPFAVYEVAMASAAPHIARRDAPGTVQEILAWAPYALATAEVAELRGTAIDRARSELERAGAKFTPSANDGYWTA